MAIDADTLIDRMHLKSQVARWRTITIAVVCIALIALYGNVSDMTPIATDHIAQVSIEGVIVDDTYQQEMLEELKDDRHVKAVLVKIDSPGGTVVGGEELYLGLRAIAKKKPVVVMMRTLCTSAGYMAALGGSHLLAREGTITGSVGVIMQTMEFTELAKRIGIEPITIKSGEQKAAPNPLEKLTQPQREWSQEVVADFFSYFEKLVKQRRNIDDTAWNEIKDGRIFTGRQALVLGLIDGIGGEKQALIWLKAKHNIDSEMEIIEIEPDYPQESLFGGMEERFRQLFFSIENLSVTLDGLVGIWQPSPVSR